MRCPFCDNETVWDYDNFICQSCGRVIPGPTDVSGVSESDQQIDIGLTKDQRTHPPNASDLDRQIQIGLARFESNHPPNASIYRVAYGGGHKGLSFHQRTLKRQRVLVGNLYVDPDQGLIFHTTNTWSERSIRIPWSRMRMVYPFEAQRGCLSFFGSPTNNLRIQYEPERQGSYFEQTDTTVEFIFDKAQECSKLITHLLEQYRENERQKENRYNQYIAANQLDKISPDRFETLVKDLFDNMGYETRLTARTGDGGVDLIARKENEKCIVQCKRYKGRVSVNIIRDLQGTMDHECATKGFLVTTGEFTVPAIKWARGKNIELIDKHKLSSWIESHKALTNSSPRAP